MKKEMLLRRLWKRGLTNGQIAKKMGVSHQLISKRLILLGLKTNGKFITPLNKELLIKYHGRGLTDSEIAKNLKVSYGAVFVNRKKLGLISNGCKKYKLLLKGRGQAECSRCHVIKPIKNFRTGLLKSKVRFRLSYCNKCFQKQRIERANTNLKTFFRERLCAIKTRSKLKKIEFNLEPSDLMNQYNKQNGKCFYTNVNLFTKRGWGKQPNALSVDRKDITRGYIPENIVLCTNRVNGIKNNLTLEELKTLIPIWYEKLKG